MAADVKEVVAGLRDLLDVCERGQLFGSAEKAERLSIALRASADLLEATERERVAADKVTRAALARIVVVLTFADAVPSVSSDWLREQFGAVVADFDAIVQAAVDGAWTPVGGGCTCLVNPNPVTYNGAVEPGDALEFDPECPAHRDAAAPAFGDGWEYCPAAADGGPDAARRFTGPVPSELAVWRRRPAGAWERVDRV